MKMNSEFHVKLKTSLTSFLVPLQMRNPFDIPVTASSGVSFPLPCWGGREQGKGRYASDLLSCCVCTTDLWDTFVSSLEVPSAEPSSHLSSA